MASKTSRQPANLPTTEQMDSLKERQRAQLISVLQAPNPNYNLSRDEAEACVRILRRMGVNPKAIAAGTTLPAGTAANSDFREVSELITLGIAPEVPLYYHAAINGEWHELAHYRNVFSSGSFHNKQFAELWADLEPANPTPASDALMNVDGRRTAVAVEKVLQDVIDSEWKTIPKASRTTS